MGKDSYHPSQFIGTWNETRHLGPNPPRNAPVYAPVVSGVTGVEGGTPEVVEGPYHGPSNKPNFKKLKKLHIICCIVPIDGLVHGACHGGAKRK